ncbi:MAG: zinc-dependent metalloprotease [Ignavibacteria bacterium]|nr:zinc-dependent metalloprotease [Ignavibacteria bacterium]
MKLQTGWFFAQAVSDPKSHRLPYSDSLMGELISFVAAHEFGHTIGMPHNMKASSSYPVDSLRSKTFCAKYGTAPSIMDYARYNYIAQPGDDVDVMPKVGPYDHFSVKWGYRPIIGAKTSDEELDTLGKWAKETESNKMLRFGRQQWVTVDPSSQMEDLGDDAVKATTYGIANLKRIMGYLYDATYDQGKDFNQLSDAYDDVVGQWSREVGHVANIPGGVETERKVFGSPGPVYTPVSKARQQEAVAFLGENVFTTPLWLIDERIAQLLTPSEVAQRLSNQQTRVLRTVISSDKLLRLLDQQARFGTEAYSVDQLLDDVEKLVLSEISSKKPVDFYRRNLQRSYVQALIEKTDKPADVGNDPFAFFFRGPNTYNTDVRAISRARLKAIQKKLQGAKGSDPMTTAHFEDLDLQIRKALDPKS